MWARLLASVAIAACGNDRSSSDALAGGEGLPCDVRAVLENACVQCHSSPPTSNAPEPLVSRADFFQPSTVADEAIAARTLARIHDPVNPMPPWSEPPASTTQIEILDRWLTTGLPPGGCGTIPPRYAIPTCASGVLWDGGQAGADLMHPGRPCVACHESFAPRVAYFFAGTVYSALHEANECESPPPAGARIEIIDGGGAIRLAFEPDANGNFTTRTVILLVPVPYTARLIANGLVRSMVGPQTSGDCNACHDEQGSQPTADLTYAPGRLVWPTPRPI